MKGSGMLRRWIFGCLLAGCVAFSAAPAYASDTDTSALDSDADTSALDSDTDASAQALEADAAAAAAAEAEVSAKVVAAASVKNGVVKEGKFYRCYSAGKLVKNSWVTYKGAKYYFNAEGRAATYGTHIDGKLYVFSLTGKLRLVSKAKVVTVGKYSYYVSTEGVASTGWFTADGKLYYADSKGRLYKNRSRDGITFSETGAAESTTASELKIVTLKIVSGITNSSMTKSQKLRACWNYVISHMSYAGYYPSGRTGWQKELALRGLKYGVGNCYGFACAFAALAYEVGYDPYIVSGRVPGSRDGAADGMTRHCWVRINGCYYDPEATYAGWRTGIYGLGSFPITHTVSSIIRFAG